MLQQSLFVCVQLNVQSLCTDGVIFLFLFASTIPLCHASTIPLCSLYLLQQSLFVQMMKCYNSTCSLSVLTASSSSLFCFNNIPLCHRLCFNNPSLYVF